MRPDGRRRVAVVLACHHARDASPPGVASAAFGRACLIDTYEVAADLVGVAAALCGPQELDELLWPDSRRYDPAAVPDLVQAVDADELVLVPADAPDLPGLVLAKVFQGLARSDVVVAPERAGPGCVALGLRLPLPAWVPVDDLDLDLDPRSRLRSSAPRPGLVTLAPAWHRLRGAAAVHRLDPALEGWEETRALLGGAGPR